MIADVAAGIFIFCMVTILIYAATGLFEDLIIKVFLFASKKKVKSASEIDALQKQIDKIPGKVLESITGSSNHSKGKLGELVAYLSMQADYDRLIPLGNIVDFIGIRFSTETEPGTMDFIDIKNGKKARLSSDQKALKDIIEANNITFIEYKVDTSTIVSSNMVLNEKSDTTGNIRTEQMSE